MPSAAVVVAQHRSNGQEQYSCRAENPELPGDSAVVWAAMANGKVNVTHWRLQIHDLRAQSTKLNPQIVDLQWQIGDLTL